MNKAVFIDKDGTLIKDIPYNVDPELIILEETAAEALKRLQANGFLLIVISNQSGVAHGLFEHRALKPVEEKLQSLLSAHQVKLDDFYFCPHHPEGKVKEYSIDCSCRKPMPGMLYQAAIDHDIDLPSSWMIGDILHDVEAGARAGCRTILIDNGNETEWVSGEYRSPSAKATSLKEAAEIIFTTETVYARL
jgi:D-glycero-D-manno-heptose 1,7-bisphosphate phosphatase